MIKFKISQTDEYERLVKFMIPFGLEFDVEAEVDTDIIKCWKVTQEPDFLVGGVVLAMREGEYIIDGIAVDPPMRKTGIGRIMIKKAVDEIKSRGGNRLFLVAKVPAFFEKLGFTTVKKETAPKFFECGQCNQYRVSCFPEVMKLEF